MHSELKRFRLPAVLLLCIAAIAAGAPPAQTASVRTRGDYNGDGRVGIADVLALLLGARSGVADSTLDYNADGAFDSADPLDLLLDILWRGQSVLDVVATPVESDEYLLNPGMGFVSVHSFNNWVSQIRHPLASVAQFRWYWDKIEPEEGRIDFGLFDEMIRLARQNGQKFMFRVMVQNGTVHVPQWLIDKGLNGWSYPDGSGGWQPDYADPLFREYHGRLIKALASRYDGNPDVDHVDIGTVGRWGEWHTSGTGLEMPPDSVRRWVVDLYLDNFKKTPLVMLIGGEQDLAYAVANGTGWRADCLGDYGMWGPNWNHMEDFYQQALDAANANEAWRNAPVVFESCGTIRTWWEDGFDLDKIISESLRWHGSLVHLGTVDMAAEPAMPDQWYDKTVEWGKKLGYRYVLRRLAHPSGVKAGGRLGLSMDWENVGVAPRYYAYPLAVRLRNTASGEAWEMRTDVDIRSWLPGQVSISPVLSVPAGVPSGEYALELALLDPYYGTPGIKLAVDGAAGDGWYGWSAITVR